MPPTPGRPSPAGIFGELLAQRGKLSEHRTALAGDVPKENLHPLVMIECPRLLFPFAREIVASAVRNGGFPPLMIDPVDFVSLYRQRMEQQQPVPPVPPAAG